MHFEEPSICKAESVHTGQTHVAAGYYVPVLSSSSCRKWDPEKDGVAIGIGKAFYASVLEGRYTICDSRPRGFGREWISACHSGLTKDANKREAL